MSVPASIVGGRDAHVPRVSVVVPAYNSAGTIERTLGTLGEQATAHPFEVIVVDSGSDDTPERVQRVLPAARVIRLAGRALAAEARNVGARAARGEILAFVDSDAYVAPDWIDQAVCGVATGYDLVCGSIENANPGSAVSRAEQLLMFNEFLPDLPPRPSWFALSGNMAMPRETFRRFGPFVAVRAAEDVVFSRRLIAAGGRIYFHPALRALHDNRNRLRPFLRNQFVIGRHTLLARRMVRFADGVAYWPIVLALPALPLVKLGKIALRMTVRAPRHLPRLLRELPLLAIGLCAHGAGMASGLVAVRPTIPARLPVGPAGPTAEDARAR